MTMTDLTEIDGIGPSYAEELQDAGYESAEAVAVADVDDLDDVLDTHDGSDIKDAADDVAAHESVSQPDDTDSDDTDQMYEFEFDFSVDQRNHLVSGLVTEEIRARRTNKKEDVESARDAITTVLDGSPYLFTKQQLDTAYRATNQLESEYRSQRGIGSFVTKIREMNQAFQSARQDVRSDD